MTRNVVLEQKDLLNRMPDSMAQAVDYVMRHYDKALEIARVVKEESESSESQEKRIEAMEKRMVKLKDVTLKHKEFFMDWVSEMHEIAKELEQVKVEEKKDSHNTLKRNQLKKSVHQKTQEQPQTPTLVEPVRSRSPSPTRTTVSEDEELSLSDVSISNLSDITSSAELPPYVEQEILVDVLCCDKSEELTSQALDFVSQGSNGFELVPNNVSKTFRELLPDRCKKPVSKTLVILKRVGNRVDWKEHSHEHQRLITARNKHLSKLGQSAQVILVMLKRTEFPERFPKGHFSRNMKFELRRLFNHTCDYLLTFNESAGIWNIEPNIETAQEIADKHFA
jgi:DNA-binding transcriptional regulator GbsR (MarR family)